eukprot:3459825-Prymnesium_polylepis.1
MRGHGVSTRRFGVPTRRFGVSTRRFGVFTRRAWVPTPRLWVSTRGLCVQALTALLAQGAGLASGSGLTSLLSRSHFLPAPASPHRKLWDALGTYRGVCLLARGMRPQSVVDDEDEVKLFWQWRSGRSGRSGVGRWWALVGAGGRWRAL